MYYTDDSIFTTLPFSVLMGLFIVWLFCYWAKRDSEGWDKSYETKGMKISRIVLMCIWGLYSAASLTVLIITWGNWGEKQKLNYVNYLILGVSLFCYELTLRQSPRSIWVKTRKVIAYVLVSILYIAFWPNTVLQFTTDRIPGIYGNALGTIIIGNAVIYGISILIIWLLLRQYKNDKFIPYKQPVKKHYVSLTTAKFQQEGESNSTNTEESTNSVSNSKKKQKGIITEEGRDVFPNKTNRLIVGEKIGFLKENWRWIVSIALFVIIVIGGISIFNYVHNEYIPNKKLEKTVSEILERFKNEEERPQYAYWILCRKHDWGYEGVNSFDIRERLSIYREEAFSVIEKKAYQNNAKWQYLLGCMYGFGNEQYVYMGKPDLEKAAYWWLESAKNGYVDAFNMIGICYRDGIGVVENHKKAAYWLQRGAAIGDEYAQKNYGDMFRGLERSYFDDGRCASFQNFYVETDGYFVRDTSKHIAYFANDGESLCERYDVVWIPKDTLLVKHDIEQAKYWWKKAAAQGNEAAKERLQKIYE